MKSPLRASTAPASTTTGPCAPIPARTFLEPGETPMENAAVPAVPRRRHPGRRRLSGAAAHVRGLLPATTIVWAPTRRRRLSCPSSWATSWAPSWTRSSTITSTLLRKSVAVDLGVYGTAELPEGQHRPQPHQPLRVHRQQVRVPHAGLCGEPGRLQHGAQHRHGQVAEGLRRRHGGQVRRGVRVRRHRLHQGDAARSTSASSSTATATPTSGPPRPSAAAWPTTAPPPTRCRPTLRRRASSCSRSSTCSPRWRLAAATR